MLEICIATLITSIILRLIYVLAIHRGTKITIHNVGGLDVGKESSEEYFKNLQTKRVSK